MILLESSRACWTSFPMASQSVESTGASFSSMRCEIESYARIFRASSLSSLLDQKADIQTCISILSSHLRRTEARNELT